MTLHVPFVIPFVSLENTPRVLSLLCRLPFVDEVTVPVFRRRHIRRAFGKWPYKAHKFEPLFAPNAVDEWLQQLKENP